MRSEPNFKLSFLHPCGGDHEPDILDIFTGGITRYLIGLEVIERPAVVGHLGDPIGAGGGAQQGGGHARAGNGSAIRQQGRPGRRARTVAVAGVRRVHGVEVEGHPIRSDEEGAQGRILADVNSGRSAGLGGGRRGGGGGAGGQNQGENE